MFAESAHLHLYLITFLQSTWDHPWYSVHLSYWYVEFRLYSRGIIFGISTLPRWEWARSTLIHYV